MFVLSDRSHRRTLRPWRQQGGRTAARAEEEARAAGREGLLQGRVLDLSAEVARCDAAAAAMRRQLRAVLQQQQDGAMERGALQASDTRRFDARRNAAHTPLSEETGAAQLNDRHKA